MGVPDLHVGFEIHGEVIALRGKRAFADADVLRLPEASHYLQEDARDELVLALLTFLQKTHRQEHEATESRRLQTETAAS